MRNQRFCIGSSTLLLSACALAPLVGCAHDHDEVVVHHRRPHEEVVVEEDDRYHRPPPVVVEERPPVVIERDRPPVVIERDRPPVVVERDHDDHRGPTERARGIPGSARLMEEGKGRIDFRFRHDGDVWVEDTHDLRVVFQARMFDGEEMVVEPGRDQILIGGRRAFVKGLQNDHRFRIYFVPTTAHWEHYGKGHDPRFDR